MRIESNYFYKKAMTDKELNFAYLLAYIKSDFSEDMGRGCSFVPNDIYAHVIELKSREFKGLLNRGHGCYFTQ